MLRRGSNQRKATRRQREANRAPFRSGDGNGSRSANGLRIQPFVLYVEGARDREILSCWARRMDHELARAIEQRAVILGGRRPARALTDFQKRRDSEAGLRGIVVLDRDDHSEGHGVESIAGESHLDVFIWGMRHIESYLLVPTAIRRLAGLDAADRRVENFVAEADSGPDALHAKRILGVGGSLSERVGAPLHAGEIARAMRRDEFHPEIVDLLGRIGQTAGLSQSGPEVVVRSRRASDFGSGASGVGGVAKPIGDRDPISD